MTHRVLIGAGLILLALAAGFGPAVADDGRHVGEAAGLAYPLATAAVLLGAGLRPGSTFRRNLVPALAVLAAGAAAGIALDRVAIGAAISLAALSGLLWIRA